MSQRSQSPKPPKKRTGLNVTLVILILLFIAGSAGMIYLCMGIADRYMDSVPQAQTQKPGPQAPIPQTTVPTTTETQPPETTLPEPEHVVGTATVTSTGDLLMHTPLYQSKYNSVAYKGPEDYDMSPIFQYVTENMTAPDFMVANLETTLYGPGKPYSGFPMFNTPDQIVDAAKDAGIDLLLTANNHCNDTGMDGIIRTLDVIREKGLKTLGTNRSADETKYLIQDVNGVRVGMLCYSYDDSQNSSRQAFNGNPIYETDRGTVNSFPILQFGKDREPFFKELEAQIAEMKEEGAQSIVLFLHWGIEYRLTPTDEQKDLAQKFCDMGVDVIVGGHPHVIEPVELLTSTTDPSHKTVCLYSLGNAVSNQRGHIMTKYIPTPHTEDGMLFHLTFEKYSDGTAYLSHVDVTPTWVNRYNDANQKLVYSIIPLEDGKRDQWKELFDVDDSTLQQMEKSYDRTMELVGEGIDASNAWLQEQKTQRDNAYLAAVGRAPAVQEKVPQETVSQDTVAETTAAQEEAA